MFKIEGAVMRGVGEYMISILRLGLKDLKHDRVKAVQLKLKATAEEHKKINKVKNSHNQWL